MRLATWNVNSVRQRVDAVDAWLGAHKIDIAALQEIKCVDDDFPREAFETLGYNVVTHGQKTFNGVALLSRLPLEDVRRGLPGMEDDTQARYIEAVVSTPRGTLRVASIYAPNGNPVGTEKFSYKRTWLQALERHAQDLLKLEEPLVLGGDFNIIPEPMDCYDPRAWAGDALFQPESRAAYRRLVNLGFTDAFRACDAHAERYTFWDYQAGAWQKNNGIRIDFQMLSPQAVDILHTSFIDPAPRGGEKPSDHVPVVVSLNL